MTCRVCGNNDTSILPVGKYADFFLLRVDTKKDTFLLFSRADSIRIRPAMLPIRALRKIGRMLLSAKLKPAVPFRTSMQACPLCHSITPCHEYSVEDLSGLYRDYRSQAYNRDRISVEPTYAQIVKDVGSHPLEIKNRNAAVDSFLNRNVSHFAGGSMIDYGGSDGRMIPSFAYNQFESIFVYDASGAPLHASVDVRKVKKIADPRAKTYSFLTCMHVLEHVGNPKALVIEAARLLAPGGLMYIEVPHELTKAVREDFERRIIDTPIAIHEHMNLFDRVSVRTLVGSIVGLELIDDAEEVVDLGWISGLIGRVLVRKVK
jgi:SAM-dependent methyltransferase